MHFDRYQRVRQRLESSLLDYVVSVTPHYQRPEHLAPLAELLDRSRRDRSEPVRAVVSVPPQHGKSQLLLHHLVRLVQEQPQLQSAYVGYGIEFARDQAALAEVIAREVSRSDSAGPPIPFQRQTVGSWATTSGGGVYWTGIGGPLTGRRVDGILIVDDPYKGRLEAESATHLRRVMEWWQAVALPRVNPGGSVVVVQARWHDADLAGQLAADGWEVINLPAIKVDGTALWPSQRPLEWLEQQRELVGEYDWNSLYLGRPQPRGDRLMRGVHTYVEAPDLAPVAGIDLAYTTSARNDRSVAIEARIEAGVIYLTNAILGHFEIEQFADLLSELEAEQFFFEPGPSEQALVRLLNDRLAQAGSPAQVVVSETRTVDKFAASQPLLALWNAGRVRVPDPDSGHYAPWVAEVVRECLSFSGTGAEADDVVDALIPLAKLERPLFDEEDIQAALRR